jgi:ABC-2 type transport system permease protein
MSSPASIPDYTGRPVPLSRRVSATAVVTLFAMSVARLVRGRRLLVLALLFSLPVWFALLGQRYDDGYVPSKVELVLIFGLIPQTLLPLSSLIFAAGMIQDELEDQTLTYLLIRPLPRALIYAVKLCATWSVTAVLTSVFVLLTFATVYEFDAESLRTVFPQRAFETALAMTIALGAYTSLFGAISIFTRRTLVVGVAYIIIFEGILANVDLVVRKITIMYYFRVATIHWLDLKAGDWNIDLKVAPTGIGAAFDLIVATAILAILGSLLFSRGEFRMKTPESA